MGVASGSGWNLWVWLLGVVVRRYIDFLILLIPTPLVSVLFCSSIPTFCSFNFFSSHSCTLYTYEYSFHFLHLENQCQIKLNNKTKGKQSKLYMLRNMYIMYIESNFPLAKILYKTRVHIILILCISTITCTIAVAFLNCILTSSLNL